MKKRITAPVGPWDDATVKKKSGNRKADVKNVQELLLSASTKMNNPACHPGTPDGLISKNSRSSGTLKAIESFQKRFLKSPDRRVDVDGTTLKKLQSYWVEKPKTARKIAINEKKLTEFIDGMMGGHCEYGFGDKASPLTIDPSKVKKIDCSGFVQYLLYTVTNGSVRIRAGSWHQNKYFEDNNFEQVDYQTQASKKDGILRLGYFKGSPGHIWFVKNAMTIESSGGKGPNRRSWSTSSLKNNVKRCYVIAG